MYACDVYIYICIQKEVKTLRGTHACRGTAISVSTYDVRVYVSRMHGCVCIHACMCAPHICICVHVCKTFLCTYLVWKNGELVCRARRAFNESVPLAT